MPKRQEIKPRRAKEKALGQLSYTEGGQAKSTR